MVFLWQQIPLFHGMGLLAPTSYGKLMCQKMAITHLLSGGIRYFCQGLIIPIRKSIVLIKILATYCGLAKLAMCLGHQQKSQMYLKILVWQPQLSPLMATMWWLFLPLAPSFVLIWMAKKYGAKNLGVPDNHYGHSSSLITYAGKVFVQFDTNRGSKVLALDISTGNQVWETPRTSKISWASPALIDVSG